jgi:hypothetical protein
MILVQRAFIPFGQHQQTKEITEQMGLFRYIKILTSIRDYEAETREITLRPKGIRRYFFGVQLHSLQVKQNIQYIESWLLQWPKILTWSLDR